MFYEEKLILHEKQRCVTYKCNKISIRMDFNVEIPLTKCQK